MSSTLPKCRFDVAVLGGGPAACAASLALSTKGLGVVQLRRDDLPDAVSYGEHLAPGAKPAMLKLGLNLDDVLTPRHHRPSHGILACWGGDEPYSNDYIYSPFGSGWNLDRTAFDNGLLTAVEKSGVEVWRLTSVDRIEKGDDRWSLAVKRPTGPRELTCRFLMDATGRAAALARRFGCRPQLTDKLVGLYARISGSRKQEQTLIIEACRDGWWYSVPLADGDHIVVFMTDSDLLPKGGKAKVELWMKHLAESQIVRQRTGDLARPPVIRAAPASSQCLKIHGGVGWLAIGDASMAFDPLSARGLEKAFEDSLRAADTVSGVLGGARWVPADFTEAQNQSFSKYLGDRHHFYSREQRWPDCTFWRRRNCHPGTRPESFRAESRPCP